MVALLKMQDLAVGEDGAIIADDPKLKVNVHGRRHAGLLRKLHGIQPSNYLPSPAQATNLPRFLVLSTMGSSSHSASVHALQETSSAWERHIFPGPRGSVPSPPDHRHSAPDRCRGWGAGLAERVCPGRPRLRKAVPCRQGQHW